VGPHAKARSATRGINARIYLKTEKKKLTFSTDVSAIAAVQDKSEPSSTAAAAALTAAVAEPVLLQQELKKQSQLQLQQGQKNSHLQ
jgi:hypothetical protein